MSFLRHSSDEQTLHREEKQQGSYYVTGGVTLGSEGRDNEPEPLIIYIPELTPPDHG